MKTVRPIAIASMLAALALSLTGCVNLKQDYPEKRLFVLEAKRPDQPVDKQVGGVLLVRKYSISQAFERAEFVYRMGEYAYESDFYNAFFAAPQQLVSEETANWLADSGLFEHASRHATRLEVSYLLEGHIVTLHGDLRNPAQPRAVLEMSFNLVDEKSTEGPHSLLYKTYRHAEPIAGPEADELAAGLSRALAGILSELEGDLRHVLKGSAEEKPGK